MSTDTRPTPAQQSTAAVSETKGRIGSQLMHGRRKEKPALKDEEARLKEIAQPKLFQPTNTSARCAEQPIGV